MQQRCKSWSCSTLSSVVNRGEGGEQRGLFCSHLTFLHLPFSSMWEMERREPFGQELSVSPGQIENTSNKF